MKKPRIIHDDSILRINYQDAIDPEVIKPELVTEVRETIENIKSEQKTGRYILIGLVILFIGAVIYYIIQNMNDND